MIQETDLPCVDCRGDLVERTLRAGDLPVETAYRDRVDVAECPRCGARYYPERTLDRLFEGASERPTPADATGGELDE